MINLKAVDLSNINWVLPQYNEKSVFLFQQTVKVVAVALCNLGDQAPYKV